MPDDALNDPTAQRWVAVELTVPVDRVDVVSGELWAAGVAGIEERDPPDERADEGTGGDRTARLVAHVVGEQADHVARLAEAYGTVVVRVEDPVAAWDVWRARATPERVGSFMVVPAWQPTPQSLAGAHAPDGRTILLDPGRAFGTGSHASTRLAARLLERTVAPAARVLDVGSGSGVLTVIACRLGANEVIAVDVDADARTATIDNARRNGCGDRIDVRRSIDDVNGELDVVVANITVDVLEAIASTAVRRVVPGGSVVLAGYLREQAARVERAYAGLEHVEQLTEGEWAACRLGRVVSSAEGSC